MVSPTIFLIILLFMLDILDDLQYCCSGTQRLSIEEQDCLKTLTRPDSRQDEPVVEEGTCTWLFSNPQYQRWLDMKQGLLWIDGKEGSGKSTLMKFARDSLMRNQTPLDAVVASFVFDEEYPSRPISLVTCLQSLLCQLLPHLPASLSDLTSKFRHAKEIKGDYGKDWTWTEDELRKALTEALGQSQRKLRIFIFIDAFNSGRDSDISRFTELFELIEEPLNICNAAGLRIIRTAPRIPAAHIMMERETTNDIRTYIKRQLRRSAESILNPETSDQITRKIEIKSQGVFQWAALVLSHVCFMVQSGGTFDSVFQYVQEAPSSIPALYGRIIRAVESDERAFSMVQWLALTERPLTIQELQEAMTLAREDLDATQPEGRLSGKERNWLSEEQMITLIQNASHGLAKIVTHERKLVVQLAYPSFRNYLEDYIRQRLERTPDPYEVGHWRIFNVCINYFQIEEISDNVSLGKDHLKSSFPFLEYATCWI